VLMRLIRTKLWIHMLLKKKKIKDDFYSMSSNNIYILQIVMLYYKNQLQVTILVPIDQV
jgi:hypothetical protein